MDFTGRKTGASPDTLWDILLYKVGSNENQWHPIKIMRIDDTARRDKDWKQIWDEEKKWANDNNKRHVTSMKRLAAIECQKVVTRTNKSKAQSERVPLAWQICNIRHLTPVSMQNIGNLKKWRKLKNNSPRCKKVWSMTLTHVNNLLLGIWIMIRMFCVMENRIYNSVAEEKNKYNSSG